MSEKHDYQRLVFSQQRLGSRPSGSRFQASSQVARSVKTRLDSLRFALFCFASGWNNGSVCVGLLKSTYSPRRIFRRTRKGSGGGIGTVILRLSVSIFTFFTCSLPFINPLYMSFTLYISYSHSILCFKTHWNRYFPFTCHGSLARIFTYLRAYSRLHAFFTIQLIRSYIKL